MYQVFVFDNKNAAANNGCILKYHDDMHLDDFWEEFTRWTNDSDRALKSPFKRMCIRQFHSMSEAMSLVEKGINFAIMLDRSKIGVTEWRGLNYFKHIDVDLTVSATPHRLRINDHEITWRDHHKQGDCFSVEVTTNPAKYISTARHSIVRMGVARVELHRTSSIAIYDTKETLYSQHYTAASGTEVFKQIGKPAQILGYAQHQQWTQDAKDRMDKLSEKDVVDPVNKVLAFAATAIERFGL